ncbi:hypothetical protein B0H14DRAFT_3538274 [Mycena olivaceomarginata]|nr:hypothetical protein B0H14DRAFT_3538274 [Mycena olivaceomarginata]
MDDPVNGVRATLINLGLSRMDAGDGSDIRVPWCGVLDAKKSDARLRNAPSSSPLPKLVVLGTLKLYVLSPVPVPPAARQGGDSGFIFFPALSHGVNEVTSATEGIIQTPRWVTAVTSLRYSDLIASGSWEGHIRIWKLDAKLKSFALIGTVPAPGVINSLQLLSPPKEFFLDAQWMSTPESTAKRKNSGTVLLVAGLGRSIGWGDG